MPATAPVLLTIETARRLLKEAGLRCTSARIAVMQQLSRAEQPLSHAEVADQLSETVFDRSTIFRVLVELADSGLLTRLDIGDQIRRYELKHFQRSRGSSSPLEAVEHPHFVCTDCGTVSCLTGAEPGLTSLVKNSKVIGSITEVLLKGQCRACRKSQS